MELKITYDPETSGSLGNAQRVQSEVASFVSDGKITVSIDYNLVEGNSGDFKVELEDCCLFDTNSVYDIDDYPIEYKMAIDVMSRGNSNILKDCRRNR
tara:strand:+ start:338 stop:631 length:294 start_codon:yes stop_codon:yes gene_type:complete